MPWATTTRPSLALGILTRIGRTAGLPVHVHYPNLDLVAAIGFARGAAFAHRQALSGLAEHLFACDLFGAHALDSDAFLALSAGRDLPEGLADPEVLRELRDEVIPAFLDRTVQRILAGAPAAVGITGTFHQVMAGLALAARLKAADPTIRTVAGGANFDDPMGQEYHRALPHLLDHVFVGEAEESFAAFAQRLRDGLPLTGIPGVTWSDGAGVHLSPGRRLPDLDSSPVPDYDDFFAEADRVRQETGFSFNVDYLPFESSRGCWWGQRRQCLFCGSNPDLLPYREKAPRRVIAEIVGLATRYRTPRLVASDLIASRTSRREIWTRLRDLDLDLDLFYETRTDLSKEEVALLHDAGVTSVQPGVESFSTELLRLMRKDTSRIRQVQFLRWAAEYRINAAYNILAGIPGERAEWYHDMAAFLPHISHLQPPGGEVSYIELHRYSPLFEDRQRFGIRDLRLRRDHEANTPAGRIDPLRAGYFFRYRAAGLIDRAEYAQPLGDVVQAWVDAHATADPPLFRYRIGPGYTVLDDTRPHLGPRSLTLSGLHEDVLLLCDSIQSRTGLARRLRAARGTTVDPGLLDATIDDLLDRDVLMCEGNLLLSLPVGRRPRSTADLRDYVLGRTVVDG